MSQLSLFSAEARPAALTDLAGLLCGPGQIVRFGAGDQARLSIVLADAERAPAARVALAAAGVAVQAVVTESGATALRTAFRCDLADLARAWTRGAVKAVPSEWQLDGPALRLWALTAGAPDGRGGYLLGLDPHAPQTHQALVAAATRAGLPPGSGRRCPTHQRHQTDGTLGRTGGARTRPDARRHVAAIPRPHGVLNRAP